MKNVISQNYYEWINKTTIFTHLLNRNMASRSIQTIIRLLYDGGDWRQLFATAALAMYVVSKFNEQNWITYWLHVSSNQ